MKHHKHYILIALAVFAVAYFYHRGCIAPKAKVEPLLSEFLANSNVWVNGVDSTANLVFIQTETTIRAMLDTSAVLIIYDPTIVVVWDTLAWRADK